MASATQDPGEACLPLPARWRGTAARSWLLAVLWLGACLVAIVVLWVATFEHIEGGRMEAIARATQEARTSAAAYQGYLERSIEHSDQLLQVVRYRWSHGGVSLEALRENGAFAGQDGLGATILDASGDCVSASLGCTPNQSFEYREYFRFHRDHPEDVAHLGPAVGAVNGRASRRTLVHLSRRLVDASGRFDGVVDVFGDGSFWAIWTPGHTPGTGSHAQATGGHAPHSLVRNGCLSCPWPSRRRAGCCSRTGMRTTPIC